MPVFWTALEATAIICNPMERSGISAGIPPHQIEGTRISRKPSSGDKLDSLSVRCLSNYFAYSQSVLRRGPFPRQ